MELAGIEPATSWVRSSHRRFASSRMVKPFLAHLMTRPTIFPNTLRLVLQSDNEDMHAAPEAKSSRPCASSGRKDGGLSRSRSDGRRGDSAAAPDHPAGR